jgi:death-on-curing protein
LIHYLIEEQGLQIHFFIMNLHGDADQAGVKFPDRLAFAVERPKQIIFGEEIYPTLAQKAGALTQLLIQTHPFHNGNKRTALLCLSTFLRINGYRLKWEQEKAVEQMVQFTINETFKGDNGAKEIGRILQENLVISQ